MGENVEKRGSLGEQGLQTETFAWCCWPHDLQEPLILSLRQAENKILTTNVKEQEARIIVEILMCWIFYLVFEAKHYATLKRVNVSFSKDAWLKGPIGLGIILIKIIHMC